MNEIDNKFRRNLIFTTTFLLFYKYSEAKISYLGANSMKLVLGNPNAVLHFLWLIWFYYFIRYYHYFKETGLHEYRKAFNEKLRAYSFNFITSAKKSAFIGTPDVLTKVTHDIQQEALFKTGMFQDAQIFLIWGSILKKHKNQKTFFGIKNLKFVIESLGKNLQSFRQKQNGITRFIRINLIENKRMTKTRQRAKKIENLQKKKSYDLKDFKSYNHASFLNALPKIPIGSFLFNLLLFRHSENIWYLMGIIPTSKAKENFNIFFLREISFSAGVSLIWKVKFSLAFKTKAFFEYIFPFVYSIIPIGYYTGDFLFKTYF